MRRKSPRVVWLPGTNANSVDAAGDSSWNTVVLDVTNTVLGETTVAEVPIVIDAQSDPLAAESSLSDVENSGYRLRRIVGKIFAVFNPASPELTQIQAIGLTAGFIIRRSDPSSGVSYAISTGDVKKVAPAMVESQGDPWIWRRSWLLQNAISPISPAPQFIDIAATNWAHGPALGDGPHIDQKTARIVSAEERLYLDISATVLQSIGNDIGNTGLVTVFYETRVLASMRTSSGNRRNASR